MPAPCRLEGTTRSRSGVARPSGKVIPSIEPFLALRINGILLVDAGYQQIATSPCRDARDLVAVAPRELGVHARIEIPGARYLRMSRDFPSAPSSMCAAHAGAQHTAVESIGAHLSDDLRVSLPVAGGWVARLTLKPGSRSLEAPALHCVSHRVRNAFRRRPGTCHRRPTGMAPQRDSDVLSTVFYLLR